MNQELKAEWVRRLRSGETLQTLDKLGRTNGRRCCLGVASDIAVEQGVVTVRETNSGEGYLIYTAVDNDDDWACNLPPAAVNDLFDVNLNKGGILPDLRAAESAGSLERETLSSLNDYGFTFDQIADVIEWTEGL